MRTSALARFALSTNLAAALLAACGGLQPTIGGPGTMPQNRAIVARADRRGSWIARGADSRHPWLYVTGNSNNEVAIYDLGKLGYPKIGAITDGVSSPADVAVDGYGTLYVANETGTITIYPAGSTSPSLTISNGLEQPQGVAVDASGNVYVANRGTSPSIQVYEKGETTPSETITGDLIQVPTQMTFDGQGNLYVSDNKTIAYELPSGSEQVRSLNLQYVTAGGGLALDRSNGILFTSGAAQSIHSFWGYPPGDTYPSLFHNGGAYADSLAIGAVLGHRYIFVPSSKTNRVAIYDEHRRNSVATIKTDVDYAVGVAYKSAGIP
jgi:hypothetical protein